MPARDRARQGEIERGRER